MRVVIMAAAFVLHAGRGGLVLHVRLGPEALEGGLSSAATDANSPDSTLRRMELFQWFLMALSVLCAAGETKIEQGARRGTYRPGRLFAISAHLFPSLKCSRKIMRSSSLVHGLFLMAGFK